MVKSGFVYFFIISFLGTLSFFGQVKIIDSVYSRAVDYANCQYVFYSLKTIKEKEDFKAKCDCEDYPNFDLIVGAISKTKTKTLAFSREFESLKEIFFDEINGNIASWLTDSIFNSEINTKYRRILNYGLQRKNDKNFSEFRRELNASLIRIVDPDIILNKENIVISQIGENSFGIEEVQDDVKKNGIEQNSEIDMRLLLVSVLMSVAISILIIVVIFVFFIKNVVSNPVKKYVHKKVSGAYFDSRFKRMELEINQLKATILELERNSKSNNIKRENNPEEL